MKRLVFVLMVVVILGGCSTRIADMTVASTKNFNINSGDLEIGDTAKGASIVPVIIAPIGSPNLKEAIDKAIEKDRCAVGLSNVVIYYNEYAFIFGTVSISVKGNLILDRNQVGCGGVNYSVSKPRQTSTVMQTQSTRSINKDQQLRELQQQNLPYEEYQRRYREIMGN